MFDKLCKMIGTAVVIVACVGAVFLVYKIHNSKPEVDIMKSYVWAWQEGQTRDIKPEYRGQGLFIFNTEVANCFHCNLKHFLDWNPEVEVAAMAPAFDSKNKVYGYYVVVRKKSWW